MIAFRFRIAALDLANYQTRVGYLADEHGRPQEHPARWYGSIEDARIEGRRRAALCPLCGFEAWLHELEIVTMDPPFSATTYTGPGAASESATDTKGADMPAKTQKTPAKPAAPVAKGKSATKSAKPAKAPAKAKAKG